MNRCLFRCVLVLFINISLVSQALSAEHEVLMLDENSSGDMVFEPSLIHVSVGDTVKFIAKDWGHNAESIAALSPVGATAFYGEINKDVTVTLDTEGVHVIQCNPHSLMGMVAVIVVGSAINLAKIKEDSALMNKNFRMKRERLEEIYARIENDPKFGS